jgi:molybdate-binding protein
MPMERTSLGLHDPEDEKPNIPSNLNILQLRQLKINRQRGSGNTV